MPASVNSDHLTVLGAAAMAGAGVCYAVGPSCAPALALAVVCLAAQLVRRQPRRHACERPPPRAAALRLLRRSRARRHRDSLRLWRALRGRVRQHPAGCRLSAGVLPAEHRDRAGHPCPRHVPNLVLEVRPTELRLLLAAARCSCSTRPGARSPGIASCCSTSGWRSGRSGSWSRSSWRQCRTRGSSMRWSRCRIAPAEAGSQRRRKPEARSVLASGFSRKAEQSLI